MENTKEEFNRVTSELLGSWENYLKSLDIKMQSTIKKILNETIGNNEIYAIFFEYEYEIMDTKFLAVDKFGNELMVKFDILIDELNCKSLFPEEWLKKVWDIEYENRIYEEGLFDKAGNEIGWKYKIDDFIDCWDEYESKKCEIYEKWFQQCWNKIKTEYNNIFKTYFSIHDTNYKIDLDTGEEILSDKIFEK
jgi:hypothetical protein